MNDDKKEIMLDLLCKQAIYGLDEQETQQLEQLEHSATESESIELTVAALGLIDLETNQEIPAHLQSKILAKAESFFAAQSDAAPALPVREFIVNQSAVAKPWFAWLGWAVAAAACVALAIIIFMPRTGTEIAGGKGTPTPTQEEKPDPARQRQQLVDSSGKVLMAKIGKGTVKEIDNVAGDVVWSDDKQKGYVRIKGLPKNDAVKETYQLWIFEDNQGSKTPIDGGTFDINSDGEVIIPIDARLKARNPNMFAVTIEKPGGVVVSGREKIAALAKIETHAG